MQIKSDLKYYEKFTPFISFKSNFWLRQQLKINFEVVNINTFCSPLINPKQSNWLILPTRLAYKNTLKSLLKLQILLFKEIEKIWRYIIYLHLILKIKNTHGSDHINYWGDVSFLLVLFAVLFGN
ncbi:hypothetical protein BpHYR1_020265 [Brachionus plicatilis]|uniref:Uncharacterized protein n=1 Tax=Brachionus plicatilis TaxID=10195 RepID=A0A3M7QK16_BRAPC|nr:hypothetical protein BpHYR1_020265 [Brachionus plicatilis]